MEKSTGSGELPDVGLEKFVESTPAAVNLNRVEIHELSPELSTAALTQTLEFLHRWTLIGCCARPIRANVHGAAAVSVVRVGAEKLTDSGGARCAANELEVTFDAGVEGGHR